MERCPHKWEKFHIIVDVIYFSCKVPLTRTEKEHCMDDFEIELGGLIEKYRQRGVNADDIIDGMDHFVLLLEERREKEFTSSPVL